MIAPGTVLGGKYLVERVLGEGGMGIVVAATHVELGHRVAIKTMKSEASAVPEVVARFEREARAVARLASEHTARVTDVGRFDDGSPFMIMEFLDGEDLAQRLAREGALRLDVALTLFLQCSIGLHDAHVMGLIHRDVKPSNIFLARRPSGRLVAKVLDFGIAKAMEGENGHDHALTQTSSVMGSPQYMSPEQLTHVRNVDARTDVWSLGASFYEALTGAVAFPAKTLAELHVQILTATPRPLRELRPDVPEELEAIVLKCLQREPENRFESMTDLHLALEAVRIERLEGTSSVVESGPYRRLPLGAITGSEAFAATAFGADGGSGTVTPKQGGASSTPAATLGSRAARGAMALSLAALVAVGVRAQRVPPLASTPAASATTPDGSRPTAPEPLPSPALRETPVVAAIAPDAGVAASATPGPLAVPQPLPNQPARQAPAHRDSRGSAAVPRSNPSPPAEVKPEPGKTKPRGSVLNPEFDE